MGGFLHDVDDDINRIRNLLEDYQPGFAFYKKPIQNAGDAGASRLDILFGVQLFVNQDVFRESRFTHRHTFFQEGYVA